MCSMFVLLSGLPLHLNRLSIALHVNNRKMNHLKKKTKVTQPTNQTMCQLLWGGLGSLFNGWAICKGALWYPHLPTTSIGKENKQWVNQQEASWQRVLLANSIWIDVTASNCIAHRVRSFFLSTTIHEWWQSTLSSQQSTLLRPINEQALTHNIRRNTPHSRHAVELHHGKAQEIASHHHWGQAEHIRCSAEQRLWQYLGRRHS